MAFSLNCIGLLHKNKNDNYEFVIRWFINDPANNGVTYLPNPDGKFYLTLTTKNSKEYLKADGTFSPIPAAGVLDLPVVSPMNYLMVAPPKDGSMPTGPIDPKDTEGKKGIGIYHILTDARQSSYAKKIQRKTESKLKSHKKLASNKFLLQNGIEHYAQNFSHYIVNSNIKPRNLQPIFVNAFKKLEEISFKNTLERTATAIPGLFNFHSENYQKEFSIQEKAAFEHTIQSSWQSASILSELFKDVDYLQDINSYVESAENLKGQLSMLVGQGIDLIDYWCNPLISQPNRVENDCGKRFPLSEALGLGLTIGNIDSNIVKTWFNSGEVLLLSVEYKPPTKNDLLNSQTYSWKDLHNEDFLEDIPALSSPLNIIKNKGTNSIENSLLSGTSCPPEVPKYSEIEYDLFIKRIKSELANDEDLGDKIQFSDNTEMGTGDGRVLLKTRKPDKKYFPKKVNPDGSTEDELSSIITGINIYGIWEPEEVTSSYKKYFTNLGSLPPMSELKQWLITRRYSYNKDIKSYFSTTNPNIKDIQSNPPKNPAFQNPGKVSNLEKILSVENDTKVRNEILPRRNQKDAEEEEIIYSLNIREGFKNKLDSALPLTWDKFPIFPAELSSLETNWHPYLWRSGQKKDIPQGYRFWATCVDVFGQESTPVSIQNIETKNKPATTLFNFKYRTSLQPPPSNKEKEAKLIEIDFKDDFLSVKWESPFEANIGNSAKYKEPIPAPPILPSIELPSERRIEKSFLSANILYLRKLHNKESIDLDDDHLDEYVLKTLSSLSNGFKNDKFRIALRELLKHNSNWKSFKWFESLTNAEQNDIWTHTTKLENIDKGYDYMALINFTIKENKQQFWTPNTGERTLHITIQDSSKALSYKAFTQSAVTIEEFPCTSNVAFTDSKLVSNPLPPRPITVMLQKFIPSKPVLGIQAIDRDLLLSNILTTPNEVKEVQLKESPPGQKALAVIFVNDPKIHYTKCQNVMIDAALSRCLFEGTKELDLIIPQKILRKEIHQLNNKIFPIKTGADGNEYSIFTQESNKNIVKNDLIGFRGVEHFKIRYNSILSSFQPYSNESEAIKYVVYQTRIQLSQHLLSNSSFSALSFQVVNPLSFSKVDVGDKVKFEEITVPISVAIQYEKGYSIHNLQKAVSEGDGKYSVNLEKEELYKDQNTVGNPSKISFFVQGVILEREIDLQNIFYEEDLLLPIGGGIKELFIWTFRTVSGLGKFSSFQLKSFQIYQTSILPPTVNSVSASQINTPQEKDAYYLNPIKHKNCIPVKLQSENDDLKRFPRIFMKWLKDENLANDIFLTIERDFRQEEEGVRVKFLEGPKNNWQLASLVEKRMFVDTDRINPDGSPNLNYNPYGIFLLKWLSTTESPTLYKWLYESDFIEVPGAMSNLTQENIQLIGPLSSLFDQKLQLPLVSGIMSDPLDLNKVVFVDYFYDNKILDDYMDTFRSYNYRLSSYIDIDPDGKFGITDKKIKYLYSKPSEWSGWLRPTFPEITLQKLPNESSDWKNDIKQPTVKINFVLKEELYFSKAFSEAKDLYYRAIVTRKINNSITTYGDKPSGSLFIEVGSALDIPTIPGNKPHFIIDENIERENAKTELSLNYKIEVSVIAKGANGRDYYLRKPKLLDITTLKIEPEKDDKECEKSIYIKIE